MRRTSCRLAVLLLAPALLIGLTAGCSGHVTDAVSVTEIHGEISLAELNAPVTGATVTVNAVGLNADDVEEVLTTQTHTGVSLTKPDDRLGFALRVPHQAAHGGYAITAHVDTNGDEAVDTSDYVTRQPFPIDLDKPGVQVSDLRLVVYPVR